ncbi:MAG TPA: FHIPEP family type III secretion protein [Kofleriaceae bacterium]|nr:FHIPEP family type III secretion protein [Kofleriaceae bacterium]
MADPASLAIAIRPELWAAIGDRDRARGELEAALGRFADRLGAAPPGVALAADAAADAPPLRVAIGDRARVPSVSSWIRASAAALHRLPRAAEIERSISAPLLAGGASALVAGITELCLELLRADPDLLGARPAAPPSADLPSCIVVTVHDADVAGLFTATDPDALGSELARLVWETTGIPIALRIAIDAAQPRGSAGVRIAGIDECPIPLLPEGHVLTAAVGSGEPVVPVAGNTRWLARADQLAPDVARIDPSWALAASLLDLVRERAPRLLCRPALDDMYRLAGAACPGTLAIAVRRLGRARLDALVTALVEHGTPISDLRCVCQAIAEFTPTDSAPGSIAFGNTIVADPAAGDPLLAFVRIQLGARIVAMLTDGEAALPAHLVDPAWMAHARRDLSPAHGERLRAAIRGVSASATGHGGTRWRMVVVVELAVRARVADLLRREFPHVSVVAFDELPPWVELRPVGSPLAL